MKQRRLGNNLNIVQRYEEKLFISFPFESKTAGDGFSLLSGEFMLLYEIVSSGKSFDVLFSGIHC